ncbi:class I SAM-dependent methyltransferase [Maribacter sp. 2307UL18-2]|uniref:class I SAM-dependent methyltransferase n=1 Tax=Maribacter sp. 2307UL18-2 TaxID=3386274 RepID=UPI0039BC430B
MKSEKLSVRDLWVANDSDWGTRGHFADINTYIIDFLEENHIYEGKLLELGCGFGKTSYTFSQIGYSVTGIDGDLERIERAKLNYPEVDFMTFKIKEKLPFEDNSFDIVFSRSVFQYIEHKLIIDEVRRVLKTDGKIILLENLKFNPVTAIGRAYLKLTKHQYMFYPWNHFTHKEILEVQRQFEDSSTHFFHLLSPICYSKFFKKLYPLIYKLDQKLLKLNFLKKFSWLVLLVGKNR